MRRDTLGHRTEARQSARCRRPIAQTRLGRVVKIPIEQRAACRSCAQAARRPTLIPQRAGRLDGSADPGSNAVDDSMRKEKVGRWVCQHALGRATEDELSKAGPAVGDHDEQVDFVDLRLSWKTSPIVGCKDDLQPWFGTRKVLRGGCWATSARIARPAYRNFFTPDRNDVIAGFRTCAA